MQICRIQAFLEKIPVLLTRFYTEKHPLQKLFVELGYNLRTDTAINGLFYGGSQANYMCDSGVVITPSNGIGVLAL